MKIVKFLLICLFLVGTTTSAMATTLWFDADGAGTAYTPVRIDELSGEAYGVYDVTTYLGDDGILNDGDTFTESFLLDLVKANLSGTTVEAYNFLNPNYDVWADLSGLSGYVFNHDDGGTDTTATNPAGILDDTYQIAITTGSVDFYFDNTDDGVANGALIGSFDVVYGESTTYLPTGNDTLTASVGLTLQASYLNPYYFYTDNGGTIGDDISLTDPITLFIALADQSNNLIEFAGDVGDPDDPTDDSIIIGVDDNGTDVEFAAVPEPATMFFLGMGLLGIAAASRKKS
jgi:hypothetical protein